MKVSISPRFQAAVCMSRTARIWDAAEGSAGDAVEGRESTARHVIRATTTSRAMRDFEDILGSSSVGRMWMCRCKEPARRPSNLPLAGAQDLDRKSTRLNSSHDDISYAVFCVKKGRETENRGRMERGLRTITGSGPRTKHG